MSEDLTGQEWNNLVAKQIEKLTKSHTSNEKLVKILSRWHESVTIGYKHNQNFSPHVNGFYMIFMVHGTWYDIAKNGAASGYPGISSGLTSGMRLNFDNPNSHLNMLATDIEIPDITEEYVSVSSRIRNAFVPSRDYFVSDFSISYIENVNLDIMRYHETWHKTMNLIKRGEIEVDCNTKDGGYFIDMPFSNAVWVAVFKPFTTEIQALIKLVGVMPVTMPLKQIIGNRSQSKMTVLNISYKSADIFYKFFNGTDDFMKDDNILVSSFKREILKIG